MIEDGVKKIIKTPAHHNGIVRPKAMKLKQKDDSEQMYYNFQWRWVTIQNFGWPGWFETRLMEIKIQTLFQPGQLTIGSCFI